MVQMTSGDAVASSSSATSPSSQPAASPLEAAGGGPGAVDFEHLRFLCAKDQRILSRSTFAAAAREDGRLIGEVRATMKAYQRAKEHCKAAGEFDPNWLTDEVQDSHSRRMTILQNLLLALEAEAPLLPSSEDTAVAEPLRGAVYSGYAHTAQAMVGAACSIQESEGVRNLAERGQAAMSKLGELARHSLHGSGGGLQSNSDPAAIEGREEGRLFRGGDTPQERATAAAASSRDVQPAGAPRQPESENAQAVSEQGEPSLSESFDF
eukprot:TRINITY_DN111569_c0_g1_i1.p1 TRINITY_DN111569_c0_g1~~TRINITY_DN111569_c0_g1_i1.p1  ORF type:complete len:266 (-),score=54.45 TRINITY_DN111569_c0_g1_i1:54-851(-)